NAILVTSPAPTLLDGVQTIHRILLAANPESLRGSVGWFGCLLGRDIVLQAEAEALRDGLGVHVMRARQHLEALAESDRQMQELGIQLHAAIDATGQQSALLAGEIVAANSNSDNARQLQQLATLAASLRITASHITLTLLNHRDLIQRVEQLLPQVELLLDQQRMLRAGLTEQAAFAAAADSLQALQGLEHVNVTDASPTLFTPDDATPR
ncbi:MAG: hypothetical protein M3R16_08705, partial [Pseudomonadota bacterium]|nr:hypothetical protein [Pseudomonadota bacterium]